MKNLELRDSSRILHGRTDFARAKSVELASEWLKRAKSSMVRAKIGKASPEILYEDLCFDAQQAAEKALKALCITYNIAFPKTHDVAYLIDLLERENVRLPAKLQSARLLTGYAVEFRYPGDYEPITKKEYMETIKIAERIVKWVERRMEKITAELKKIKGRLNAGRKYRKRKRD